VPGHSAVSSVQAQAFAGLGELAACQRALDAAEQVRELSGDASNGDGFDLMAPGLPRSVASVMSNFDVLTWLKMRLLTPCVRICPHVAVLVS
jgi:hypothetical protein